MKYYVLIEYNILTTKGTTYDNVQLEDNCIEISKELYEEIQLPATFDLDNEGNLINITPLPQPEPEPTVPIPTTEERLLAIEEVLLNLL